MILRDVKYQWIARNISWGIINIILRERHAKSEGRRISKCRGSRNAWVEKWGYLAGFYHRALHCSLTISSFFSERGRRRAGTNERRKSCGTCRCSHRPCHCTWKTSITRQSLKRRPPHLLVVEKTRKKGSCRKPTKGHGAERTSFKIPSEGREFLRKNLRCFPRDEADGSFFLSSLSLFLPPFLSLCHSLSLSRCFFPRSWVTSTTLGDIS